ncbi:LamG-like jellyroll fold domain-containing protein [Maribacter sp. 2-571]|uniref:LamG-like jellyroll fold domain-containing protein n=1 Tax=Maribacter sp. 2-571 TaxID=3417569 RepID=UPI003D3267BC
MKKPSSSFLSFMGTITLSFMFLFCPRAATGQESPDLVAVVPITDKILSLEIDEGQIDYWGVGQTQEDNITYVGPLDLVKTGNTANYQISSSDDANYQNPQNPIYIGRKSKATEYNNQWHPVPYVWGHQLYLQLPSALRQGSTYTLNVENLVGNLKEITFVYDVDRLRSETVHVNMIGFPRNGQKFAYLSQWMGNFDNGPHQKGGLDLDDKLGNEFRILEYRTGETVFSGTIEKRADKTLVENENQAYGPENNYSHADVWQCDFTAFNSVGEYIVAVEGIGCSYPFEINDDINKETFYYAMKGLFWQRQGIVKEMENGKIMPRDHHPDDIVWRYDKDWEGSETTNATFNTGSPQVKNIWGHYHDAGDWDAYISHAKTPMSLLLLYDLYPGRFYDGEVDNRYKLDANDPQWIDEGTNGVPDLLDEASWLIKYYRRARTVLQRDYGGTGGVPGYTGRDGIEGGDGIVAWTDFRDWYVSAENTEQTFLYAGLASWYAVCLNKLHQLTGSGNHPEFDEWVREANEAYAWANARGNLNNEERRARGFAAGNLFRATGNSTYQDTFRTYRDWEPDSSYGEWSGPNSYDMVIASYALIPQTFNDLDVALQNDIKTEIRSKATDLKVDRSQINAFRNGMENYQSFELGPFTTPRMTLVAVAHRLTGDEKYLNTVQNAANYVLGGNQLNLTYLSGLGERDDKWVFNPNGWLVNDYNSKVYYNEANIGYTSYFGAMNFWFTDSVFSEFFARGGSFPQANDTPNVWPEAESKFYNKFSIQGGEYTIHQQNNYMIYTMGFLKASSNASGNRYTLNPRPTLVLNLSEGQNFSKNGCELSVSASADTRVIKYYYEWHYIGESRDAQNNFALTWQPALDVGTEVLITAVAYDDRGRISLPTPAGEKNVVISDLGCNNAIVLDVTVNGTEGSVTKDPDKASYELGESVVLTAIPNDGYAFDQWSGAIDTTENPITITMDGSKSITASFAQTGVSCSNTGTILVERFEGILGTAISDLTNSVKYPDNPDTTYSATSFEAETDVLDEYGLRMRGHLCPPVSGNYRFWVAGDDHVALWLGTGEDPNSANRIAYHTSWTGPRDWNVFTTQRSAQIQLEAGKKYYIEALMKEGYGLDNLAVGWSKPGEPTSEPSEVIPGSSLIPYVAGNETPKLLHHWEFDNSPEDIVGDKDASLVNGAVYADQSSVGSASLDLSVSDRAMAELGTIVLPDTFTITMWAFNNGEQEHQNWLLGNNDSGAETGFNFFVNSWDTTDGTIAFQTQGENNSDFTKSAAGAFPFDQWNLVALTVSNGEYVIYVNGVSVHTGTVSAGTRFDRTLFLGAMGNGNSWNTWSGRIDEVKLYARLLSVGELSGKSSGPTAVEQKNGLSRTGITLYPNPAKEMVRIQLDGGSSSLFTEIKVYNMIGQELHRAKGVDGSYDLNVAKYPSGMYFVRILQGDTESLKKFVVE